MQSFESNYSTLVFPIEWRWQKRTTCFSWLTLEVASRQISLYVLPRMPCRCDPSVGRSESAIRRLLNALRGKRLAIFGCVPKLCANNLSILGAPSRKRLRRQRFQGCDQVLGTACEPHKRSGVAEGSKG